MWISISKMRITQEKPFMSRLVFSAISNMPESLKEELTERYNTYYTQHMPKFFGNIDTSKFRKDIDSQKAIELIVMSMDGIASKYLQKYRNKPADEMFNDMENIMNEFNQYMDILKFGIYCETEEKQYDAKCNR